MRIGELADVVGVNPKAIRYYESIGLLPSPERLPSGYREYTEDDVERLRFVKTAQRLNLALSEISEILGFRERAERPCEYVLGVLDRQVADLERRMTEMAQLRDELIALKAKADHLSRDEACYCAVIEHADLVPERQRSRLTSASSTPRAKPTPRLLDLPTDGRCRAGTRKGDRWARRRLGCNGEGGRWWRSSLSSARAPAVAAEGRRTTRSRWREGPRTRAARRS